MPTTAPAYQDRQEQSYMSVRAALTVDEMAGVGKLFDEIFEWADKHGVTPNGAAFIRYNCINMREKIEIEVGVPVANIVAGDGRVSAGTIPAGRYAFVVYTGDYSGLMEANRVLIDWAKENGITWDVQETDHGDEFAGRFEFYLNGPADEPDSSKWTTEVAIKLPN